MEIITQIITGIQELVKKLLHSFFSEIPIIFIDCRSTVYVLVKEMSDDIDDFILTGKTSNAELHILSTEQEEDLRKHCRRLGLKCSFHSQTLEYTRHKTTVIYPRISNAETDIGVAVIPWFMLPGRPYPIFAYAYAIWHYFTEEQTNMKRSAAAARDLFGTGCFDASTLSRSIKAMRNIIDVSMIDKPLSAIEPSTPPTAELIGRIPELLIACPTIESLEKALGVKTVPLPAPINRKVDIPQLLISIPKSLCVACSDRRVAKKGCSVTRKSTARKQKKEEEQCEKRKADFVETPEDKGIRLAFIKICKAMALNVAIGFHRALISTKKFKNPTSCATTA